MNMAKLLIAGPPGGPQGNVVGAISEVKIRSSTRSLLNQDFVPMDFGRVKLGIDLDLQLFAFERDQLASVAEAVSPGIVGALVIVDEGDALDPHFAAETLDELAQRGITWLVAAPQSIETNRLIEVFSVSPEQIARFQSLDRESVKELLVKLLEQAMHSAAA